AVRVGRIGIAGTGATLEWATPVLYLRGEETQDVQLFTVAPTSRASLAKPAGPSAELAARTAAVRALDQQAMAGFRSGRYDKALHLFDSLVTLDPDYADAAERREACRLRQRVNDAYKAAATAEQAGDWAAAIRGYTAVLDLEPGHGDAARRREDCWRRQHIADLHNEM